jgi:hypothetical protein
MTCANTIRAGVEPGSLAFEARARRARFTLARWTIAFSALTLALASSPASAVGSQVRLLSSISVHQRGNRSELQIYFGLPVRYLRHTPERKSAEVVIEIAPIAADSADTPDVDLRGALSLTASSAFPLDSVRVLGSPAEPRVEVRFARAVNYMVRQGDDARSVVVSIPVEQAQGRDAVRAGRLMREAQDALAAGQLDRSILLYTSVIAMPESSHTRWAMELLGVARERNGQLAQAAEQYRSYLQRYPDGEDSRRVRQRLMALISANEGPVEPLRAAEGRSRRRAFDMLGSLSTYYTHAERIGGDFASGTLDSSQLFDVYLTTRLRTERFDVRSRLATNYRFDYQTGGTADDARIRDLSLELTPRERRFDLVLGRQSHSRGGVLGRYDGVRVDYSLTDHLEIGGVAGFPLDSGFQNNINTDAALGGLRIGFSGLAERTSGEIFGVFQKAENQVDRAALGGELRYRDDWGIAVGLLDFDVYFASLNRLLFMGNWNATPKLDLNALAQFGNTPFVTSRNALIGSGVDSLGDVPGNPSESQIRDLALDRTGKLATFSAGGSYRLAPLYRVTLDLNATDFSGTDALDKRDATGFEFSYLAQLTRDALIMENDVHTLGVRAFDGRTSRTYALYWLGRLPLTQGLYLNPRLRAEFRDAVTGVDQWTLRPSARLEYRWSAFAFDVEAAYEARMASNSVAAADDSLYSLDIGLRYDF